MAKTENFLLCFKTVTAAGSEGYLHYLSLVECFHLFHSCQVVLKYSSPYSFIQYATYCYWYGGSCVPNPFFFNITVIFVLSDHCVRSCVLATLCLWFKEFQNKTDRSMAQLIYWPEMCCSQTVGNEQVFSKKMLGQKKKKKNKKTFQLHLFLRLRTIECFT